MSQQKFKKGDRVVFCRSVKSYTKHPELLGQRGEISDDGLEADNSFFLVTDNQDKYTIPDNYFRKTRGLFLYTSEIEHEHIYDSKLFKVLR